MNMLKYSFISTFFVFALLSTSAWAIDLQDAKNQGLVGETTKGYLAALKGKPSAEVKKLIEDINAKRKAKYQEVAKKVGKSLSVVEQLAGEKAQAKTKAGHYIQTADGKWKKR